MRIITPDIKALFKALPKAELHVHLSGAYPLNKIKEFFRKKGFSESEIAKAAAPQDKYENLTDFVNLYLRLADLVKEENQITEITEELCLKAAEDNVRYIELKLAGCELLPRATQSEKEKTALRETMYQAVIKGVKSAQDKLQRQGFTQTVKFIYAAERHNPPSVALEDAKQAVTWAKTNPDMIGFDLAGDENISCVTNHKEAIDYAISHGLKFTCHAGETPQSEDKTPVESMLNSINIGAQRIGHGLYACTDDDLIKKIKENNILIEVSPTSNVATLSVESYKTHPISNMLKLDLPIALCSDDPSMFNTKISNEYEQLYKNCIINDWDTIKKLVMNGIKYAFCDNKTKTILAKEFEEELKLIENSEYFKKTIKNHLSGNKK